MQLYKGSNTNFEANGDFNLDNIMSDYVFSSGINKIWEIEVEIEFDKEEKWRNINQYDVLKCDTPMLKNQLFRIYDIDTSDSNLVINARLLFYDLSKKIILDSRNVNATGQQAIDKALQGTKYTGHSNITKVANCNWIKQNIVNALMSAEDYSFVSNYKGELWVDNFDITLQDSIGGDYGVQCTYAKDIESIEKTIDIDPVITRLIPYGNNNLMLDEIYVDSPLINNYPIIQEREISFDDVKLKEKPEDEGFNTKAEAQAELIKRCQELFANGLDKPPANFKVSIISLENTEEYKDFKNLVNIGLGDTVRIYYKPLGIDLNSRCISLKWNGISKKYLEVELGNYIEDFNDIISDISNKADNANKKIGNITDGDYIIAEKVKGFLNGAQTSLKASKGIAELQDYRVAQAEDLNPSSPNYGSTIWGTNGIFLSNKRTLDNKDWDYTTAMTPAGINAEILIGKLLANADGTNFFDLIDGIIKGKNLIMHLTNGDICTYQGGQKAIEMKDQILSFFDWEGTTRKDRVGLLYSSRSNGEESKPGIAFGHMQDSFASITYYDDIEKTYFPYINFDFYNVRGTSNRAINFNLPVEFKSNLWSSIINSATASSFKSIDGFTFYVNNIAKFYHVGSVDDLWSTCNFNISKNLQVNGNLTVSGTKNCVQKTENYGDRLFYSVEDGQSFLTETGASDFTVIKTENDTFERTILINNIYKECVNLDFNYIIEINKVGWGDYRIKEKTRDYFILESDREDFLFNYCIKAKRKGYENENLKEFFKAEMEAPAGPKQESEGI